MEGIRPIRNDDDLAWAVAEISRYFENEPAPGSPEADRFDVLSDLIEAYENRSFPLEGPEPIDLLKSHMETTGRSWADLAALLGSRSRASEVLNRRRALTVGMIHKISTEWRIPSDCLVTPYALKTG